MPAHRRSAVAGTTALLVCAVSSVSAYTSTPLLRVGQHASRLHVQQRAMRRVAVGPSMIYTPPRIDENDLVAVENLKRSLDRLVEMPSAEPNDQVMMRSPCTSLYGNWRPTTGTDSIQQSTRKAKPARSSKLINTAKDDTEQGVEKKKQRGRPQTVMKAAVREELLPEFVARAAHVLELNGGSMDSNLFGQHWKQAHPEHPIYTYKSVKGVTIHQMLRENSRFFHVSDTTRHKVKFFELIAGEVKTFLSECRKEGYFEDSSSLVASMAQSVRGAVDSIDEAILVDAGEEAPVLAMGLEAEVETGALDLAAASMDATTTAPMAVPQEESQDVIHHHVPMQGKARYSTGFDRRLKAPPRVTKESRSFDAYREEMPQEPVADERDAIEHPVVSLYNSWAVDGRDVVMEVTHATAFDEVWEYVTEEKLHPKREFTAIDGGCGNGWAARKISEHPLCKAVVGVDAAAVMVDRAHALTAEERREQVTYQVGDVASWAPEEEVDIVSLCETLYLLDEPQKALDNIVPKWLKPGGLLVANLDCYWENKLSHAWENDLGVPMHCLSETEWEEMFEKAGLTNVKRWRSKQNGPWQGTLLISGERKA